MAGFNPGARTTRAASTSPSLTSRHRCSGYFHRSPQPAFRYNHTSLLTDLLQGTPTMRQIQIGSNAETVVERADYPPERIRQILGNETVAVLGYGVQGRGQSLNMKDNGVRVIIGLRDRGRGW